jgi:hypothetical protein
MRLALALIVLAGCKQVFGLAEPDLRTSDAAPVSDGSPVDAPLVIDALVLPACDPADVTLIACFDFEGQIADQSASQLVVSSSGISFDPGMRGQAMVGTESSVVTIQPGAALAVTAVTIEAWIHPVQLPATRFGVWDTDQHFGVFVYADGRLAGATGGGASGFVYSPAGAISTNRWTHVALTIATGTARLFIDGALVVDAGVNSLATSGDQPSSIGGNAPSGDRFVGLIDQLRLYNVRRTPAEICAAAGRSSC